jgi:acyl-CoA synthetase (AMP-forming)/AMP-acid ligase II
MKSTIFDPVSVNNRTIRQIIDHWAELSPDEIFLIDPDEEFTVTFRELQRHCQCVADTLNHLKVGQGETVAYAMTNGGDAAMVILGIMYGGYIATSVNLVSGKTTIAHVMTHSEAAIVVVDEGCVCLIEEALNACEAEARIIRFSIDWFSREPDDIVEVDCECDALLMYTSGTTGLPKGVVHTHSSLIAGGSNTAFAHKLQELDRALCVLPLFHINGLCVTLLGALVSRSSLVIPHRFSISQFWQLIRKYRCSWFSAVPTQISYLLNHAQLHGHDPSGLENLRFGRSASAPLSPEVQQAFESMFQLPIVETMGLTETAAQILSNPIDGPFKIGSPGIAYGNEVMIGFDNQEECPRGVEGEVLVRGANVMRGYRNNPRATTAALTRDGWLRTGDLGKMDDDNYVFITGRLKELIIKGGENIAPREVDEALYCHPDVIEAAAFARDNKQYGQSVEAGVMVKQGSPVTMEELIVLCHDKIGSFKSPDIIHFLPELPKGPSGKIQRMKLAQMT